MPLSAGSKLSFYEVLAPLGAGAMGEVWRAKDTRLGREVAIKVLPEHFASDEERLRRFEREAKTLATVNHSNVAQIFGVDQVGDTCFLVLELVPGQNLDERLKKGPLSTEDALEICEQIAQGLEAAHEAGVIHRDLKPANVRLTPEGKIKLLDFGLAKPASESHHGSSTDSVLATEAGRLLGTPTYMAPEQARGKSIDKRVDIWAFGCVLYECLTGKRAFDGETLTDVLTSVLHQEVDVAKLHADVPPRVRELLARCLAKDPRRRLRDIGEARIVLGEPGSAAHAPAAAPAARKAPVAIVGLAALLLGSALTAWWMRAPAPSATPASGALRTFTRLTDLPGPETNPDLSPDGNTLLYVSAASGNRDIYSLRVGGNRSIGLTADCAADDSAPRFSRDGQAIVFRSERDGGGLFVMGATGENVRRITDRGFDPCWSPDGKQVAFSNEPVDDPYQRLGSAELWVVEVGTGALRKLSHVDAVQPAWSPDGKWIACWSNPTGQRDLLLVPAAGGEPLQITFDTPTDWSPAWSPDGARLYFSSDRGGSMNLWSLALDPASGKVLGEPRPETNGVRNIGFARFSADGKRMTCFAYERAQDYLVHRLDPEAHKPELLHELRRQAIGAASISPDGRWIVGATTEAREDIVLLRSDGGELRRLTNDAVKDRTAACSPDGKSILFKSTRTGKWQPWVIRFDGSGLAQVGECANCDVHGWDADGSVAYASDLDGDTATLFALDMHSVATVANAPKVVLDKDITNLTCVGPGPRLHTLFGAEYDASGAPATLGILDVQTGKFERFAIAIGGTLTNVPGALLPDGKRAIVLGKDAAYVYDLETKAARKLEGCAYGQGVLLSGDGRTLVIVREVYDGDVWLGDSR